MGWYDWRCAGFDPLVPSVMKSQKFVIMGVSGSGKSTIGALLAESIEGAFYDGDDFHPPANIEKMASGRPLNDEDRKGWLEKIAELIETADEVTIIACSALKKSYRDLLRKADFIYLDGSRELIESRLRERKGHYMPPSLLESQFSDLEVPENALVLDIDHPPEELVSEICVHFGLMSGESSNHHPHDFASGQSR